MATQNKTATNTADRELILTRLLNALRALVWEVWTNPDHVKNWWGPNGFTNTIFTMDVKPGGEWDFIMHGPDGTDYKNKSIYREIIKPEKIVFDHVSGPKFTTTVRFEEQGDKTLLTWHMLFETKEQFEQVVKTFKADEGQKQNVDKLEKYLCENSKPIIIERVYNAPLAKVWQALTDNDQMKKWYFDIADFKPEVGFEFSFAGEGKEGEKYIHLCKVTEVIKEKKLRYSWRYQGFEGNSFVTFELSAEGEKTKLRLTHAGLETFPATSSNAFAKENFMEGWTHITGVSLNQFLEN